MFQKLRKRQGCFGRDQSGEQPLDNDLNVCLDDFLHEGERVDDGLEHCLKVAVLDLLLQHFLGGGLGMEVWVVLLINQKVDFLVKAKRVLQLLRLGLSLLSADLDEVLGCIAILVSIVLHAVISNDKALKLLM